MLLDGVETGDDWHDVACRWLHANEELWQKWIPDETECFAQFGLFNELTKESWMNGVFS